MAAPSDKDPVTDPVTDLTSPDFDAAACLKEERLELPFPNVRTFNNLAEYATFMKYGSLPSEKKRSEQQLQKKTPSSSLGSSEEQKPVESTGSGSNADSRRNVVIRMSAVEGPLGILQQCINDRVRLRVCIRSFKGLRSICTGYLVAFDKSWNFAMQDVDETYRKPPLGKRYFHEDKLSFSKILQQKDSPSTSCVAKTSQQPMMTTTFDPPKTCEEEEKPQGIDGGEADELISLETKLAALKNELLKLSEEEERNAASTTRIDELADSQGQREEVSEAEDSEQQTSAAKTATEQSRNMENLSLEENSEKTVAEENPEKSDVPLPPLPPVKFYKRHVNQLFIRGDNVVLVSIVR